MIIFYFFINITRNNAREYFVIFMMSKRDIDRLRLLIETSE